MLMLGLLLAPVLCRAAERRPKPDDDNAAQLKAAKEERVELLAGVVEILTSNYKSGSVDILQVFSAENELCAAQLDSTAEPEKRIALLTKQLDTANDFLKVVQARFDAGNVTELDLLQAKTQRLGFKIKLLQEGAAATGLQQRPRLRQRGAIGVPDKSKSLPIEAAASPASLKDAKAVVTRFLEAIRKGNNDAATKLLTKVARQKTEESGRRIVPPANEFARIEVDEAVYITPGHDIAHVPTRWIDKDENGIALTDKATWVCRLEPDGWRVSGVAAYVFEDEDPLLLNFEDPADMAKKQEGLKNEIERRAKQAAPPAGGKEP